MNELKEFIMTPLHFKDRGDSETFTEETAPNWLRYGGIKGSTMDMRWFWDDYVITLQVGQTVDTDFQRIKRTK